MSTGISGPALRVGVVGVALCSCALVRAGAGAYAAEGVCTPPAEIPPTHPTPVERANPHARIDYHLLVLTWARPFVARHPSPACAAAAAFVTGGLIPRSRSGVREDGHPRHCIPSMPLSRATVRRHFAVLPDAQFMQDLWVRYGGCAFANAGEYLDRLTELYARVRQPDLRPLASRARTTAGAIRAAFVAANGGIGLAATHLAVAGNPTGWLESVATCYDPRFRLMVCPRPGLSDRTPLRLADRGDVERHTPRRQTPSLR